MDVRHILGQSDQFIRLIDHPATSGGVLQLMGPCIQLSMAQAIARA